MRGRKINISLILTSQSNFIVPKDIRLNVATYFIIKIPNKSELQQHGIVCLISSLKIS